jgi:hypothetical protein
LCGPFILDTVRRDLFVNILYIYNGSHKNSTFFSISDFGPPFELGAHYAERRHEQQKKNPTLAPHIIIELANYRRKLSSEKFNFRFGAHWLTGLCAIVDCWRKTNDFTTKKVFSAAEAFHLLSQLLDTFFLSLIHRRKMSNSWENEKIFEWWIYIDSSHWCAVVGTQKKKIMYISAKRF